MITREFADHFTQEWIDSWNSHNLERILSHYTDHFEMSSPYIATIAGEPSGVLKGKVAIAAYWAKALARIHELRFKRGSVLWGVNSIVINYERQDGRLASEWFELGENGKVIRSAAHYLS